MIFMLFFAAVAAQDSPIDLQLAQQYFHEAQTLCEQDRGQLWGVSLCGPLLFVEPASRRVVANQADEQNQLTRRGDVFVGQVSPGNPIANMAVTWGGVKWAMVIWPLPENKFERAALLLHESWHRIQNEIGLLANSPANHHLETVEGRIWLQLEWRALAAALRNQGEERRQAAADALVFRAMRRQIFERAAEEERQLEMHEGLAEYSGIKLCGIAAESLAEYVAKKMSSAHQKRETFVRSFAYVSGPMYGVLLDESGIDWRKNLKPSDDLGWLLQQSLQLILPENLKAAAEMRMRKYDGESLRAAEAEREQQRQALLADYRARFVEGPVFILPLAQMQISFDPNQLQPLDSLGTIYRTLEIKDRWGTLQVTNGALLSADWSKVSVPAPAKLNARALSSEGWSIQIKEGWKVVPAGRPGDYTVKPE